MIIAATATLAEPTRLAAMRILRDGDEHRACDPMICLEAMQRQMSRHTQVLKQAGFVVGRQGAQWGHYQIRSNPPPNLQSLLRAALVDEVKL